MGRTVLTVFVTTDSDLFPGTQEPASVSQTIIRLRIL